MARSKKNFNNKKGSDFKFKHAELESFIKLEELPFEQSMQMLKEAGLNVGEEEATRIMDFLHLLARITIKEIFSTD